jgi:small-conductance mechanosensitive channel
MRAVAQAASEGWFETHGLPIAITLASAILLSLIAKLVVRKLEKRMESLDKLIGESNRQRTTTVTHTLLSAALVVIWVIAVLITLGELGVNLAPLIAGAGIAGVALGFGAQTLVKDGLSGFFILLENQFGLGDAIDAHTTAGLISGRVEGFNLRVTSIRMFDGALNYIPNGNIQVVANRSRGWARAIVDVRVAYDEDVDKVRQILDELFDQLREGELEEALKAGPEVLGVQTLASDAVVIRVIADATPGTRTDTERILRERITARLAERGVRVPTVHQIQPPSA